MSDLLPPPDKLTGAQELLLYEIYGLTEPDAPIAARETNIDYTNRVTEAINKINIDPNKVARVGEILEEYDQIALDPSNIDKDGYSFRMAKSIRLLTIRLYTYTGIPVRGKTNNQFKIG